MPGPISVQDGALVTKDESEVTVYTMDYDTFNLSVGVQLASVGAFTVTPSGLTQDSQALLAGNRQVRVRLSGGTKGVTYTVEHTVTTNESPSQTKSKWFRLQVT